MINMLSKILYSDKRIYEDIKSLNPLIVDLALGQLYNKFYNGVLNYVGKNSGSKEQAEDILADAVIIFYENIKNNKFDFRDSIKPYFFKIVNNLWLEELKKMEKDRRLKLIPDLSSNIDDIVILEQGIGFRKNTEEMISEIFNQIGVKCKEILIMFYYYNYSMKEIAEELDFSNGESAKVQKNKCMQRIKTQVNLCNDFKEELLINKNIIENY